VQGKHHCCFRLAASNRVSHQLNFVLGKNSSLTEFIRCKWVGVVVVCVRGVGGAGVGSRRPTV
jgi:hypothetical protein